MKLAIEFKDINAKEHYIELLEKKGFTYVKESSSQVTLWIHDLYMVNSYGNTIRITPNKKKGFMYDVYIQNEDISCFEIYMDRM